jgi:hypothetical protein
MIATDLQRQDIYDAIESNENSFYYIFGAVTCPVVAIVLVTGLFISIVLGVISHMLLAYCKQSLMKRLTKKEDITIATIPPPSTPPPTTAAIYHRRRDDREIRHTAFNYDTQHNTPLYLFLKKITNEEYKQTKTLSD